MAAAFGGHRHSQLLEARDVATERPPVDRQAGRQVAATQPLVGLEGIEQGEEPGGGVPHPRRLLEIGHAVSYLADTVGAWTTVRTSCSSSHSSPAWSSCRVSTWPSSSRARSPV